MRDNPDQIRKGGGEGAPMTLLAVKRSYWLYEGDDLLNDMLFGRGAYPFKVCCLVFNDNFELNTYVGDTASVAMLWRVHPDIVDRVRADGLLIEIFKNDV
jgi:hypothetical protein